MMATDGASTPTAPPGGRQRLLRQLRLVVLLVVVLAGVLGGLQIWQLRFARTTYVVRVREEFDVTGQRNQSMVDTAELLERMDFELRLQGEPEPLLGLAGAEERMGPVTVKGSERSKELHDARVTGILRYPGADPDRLRFEMAPAQVHGDTLDFQLTHNQADDFLGRPIDALLAVRNQLGQPITGLVSDRSDLRPVADGPPGVYRVGERVDELLTDLLSGLESLSLTAHAGEKHYRLEVPLEWFVREGHQEHVIVVEEVVEFAPVLPAPARLSPERIVSGTGFGGRLELAGRDLDLAEGARLEGSSSVLRLELLRKERDRLSLAVDAARLRPGSYDLVVESPQAPDGVRLPRALAVVAGLQILEPAAGAEVSRGEPLRVRWSSSGLSGEILVEAQRTGDEGQRWTIFRGPVEAGRCEWATEGLPEGDYLLSASLPGREDIQPLQRPVVVLPPPELEVRLRFLLDGRPYGNMRDVRIDDRGIELGADPMLVRVKLTPGLHRIRATGSLVQPYVGQFEVTDEGQLIDVVLSR